MKKTWSKVKTFIEENRTVFWVVAGLFVLLVGAVGYGVIMGDQWDDSGVTRELREADKRRDQQAKGHEETRSQLGVEMVLPTKDTVKASIDLEYGAEFDGADYIDYQAPQIQNYVERMHGREYWLAYISDLLPDDTLATAAQKSLYIELLELVGGGRYINLPPIYAVTSNIERTVVNNKRMGVVEMDNEEQSFDEYLLGIEDATTDTVYMNPDFFEVDKGKVRIINPMATYIESTGLWTVSMGIIPTSDMTLREFYTELKGLDLTIHGQTISLGQGSYNMLDTIPFDAAYDIDAYIGQLTASNEGSENFSAEEFNAEELKAEASRVLDETYISDVQMIQPIYEFEGLTKPTEGPLRLTIGKDSVILTLSDYKERAEVR